MGGWMDYTVVASAVQNWLSETIILKYYQLLT